MKFLAENRKKNIKLVAVLVVCLAGIVYFNFSKSAPPQIMPSDKIPGSIAVYNAAPGAAPVSPTSSAGAPRAITKGTGVLPYGSRIDTRVLDMDAFKDLRSAPQLIVRPDELGRDNPFSK